MKSGHPHRLDAPLCLMGQALITKKQINMPSLFTKSICLYLLLAFMVKVVVM